MNWIEFKTPERLWVLLVLPALVIVYLILLRLKGRTSLRFTNTGVLGRVVGSQRRWTRHMAVAMSLCSLVALGLAWAQPLGTEKVPRERATVVLILDTSLSMEAQDVEPNRLDAAKAGALDFVQALPASYNVALVALDGSPSVVVPATTDRGPLERVINSLKLGEGTAIGDALSVALDAIEAAPGAAEEGGDPPPAMIVLLSDGTNTEGTEPAQGARRAKQAGVPVFTIAYGTQNGYVDLDGKRHNVAPDREALEEISRATEGEAVAADSVNSLKEAYKRIGSSVGMEEVKKPVTAQYALGALGFAIVAALGAVMMAARWPR
ncbi:VWA domain-containing protein [Arachnia propionica]|uniref:VWA domain-containing protein n=1 Tax=Arachnia propionica TaxID=1750 RepID=A0A3P1WVG1_9ACTN|nr:VWA domain-containing protein [Arachnia propionica]RRD50614.1 VWA domain-containing protein [Arachnia propionica]